MYLSFLTNQRHFLHKKKSKTSRNSISTNKCWNGKTERHDPGSNPGRHSCVWV